MINIKKISKTIFDNPEITLFLTTYLIMATAIIPAFFMRMNGVVFIILTFLTLLFTSAFLSGWCGVIYHAITKQREEDFELERKRRIEAFKEGFFGSIPLYIGSVFLYIVLLLALRQLLLFCADYFFGNYDYIFANPATFDKDTIQNTIISLPHEVKAAILKRSAFLCTGFLGYLFLTFYSIPALYFEKTINPFMGLKYSLLAILKRPWFSVSLFLLIVFFHVLIIFIEALSILNPVIGFLALILRIYFIVFVVVLIFSVYEENFCNNRSHSLGENESGN